MKINRGRERATRSEARSETFTGEVWADPVLQGAEGVALNNVFFAPRARTHWHRHERGQILHVTSGEGRVATRDGQSGTIAAGDTVWIPPGEEHWHGASEQSFLLHLAISIGRTEWLDAVTDADYDNGAGA
jgi:quercetin dioxygenase-like cupin family protein